MTQPLPAADPSVCAPRGTLPPRPSNVAKTPHRKNLNSNGSVTGQSGSVSSQRNRTVSTTTAPQPPAATVHRVPTTAHPAVASPAVTEPSVLNGQVAAVWGQGVSLNHEKPPPSLVMIETPLNDIVHLHNHSAATQETTASQELSSRRASVVHSSSESTLVRLGSLPIILIALCCTHYYNSLWASCSSRSSGSRRS